MKKALCTTADQDECKEPATQNREGEVIIPCLPSKIKEESQMNCLKPITLTGYVVRFVDLRKPNARNVQEEVFALDRDTLAALALLGLNLADFIEAKYARGGYHVTGVERIHGLRAAEIDLCMLWEMAEPAGKEAEAV